MSDLKQDLQKEKPIYGLEETMKKIKHGKLKRVYMASNCNEKESLLRYGRQFNVEVIELKEDNSQLGVACKRPHTISVLSFEK